MIKALCFDFDGTLARFEGNFNALMAELWAELALDTPDPRPFQTELARHLRDDDRVTLQSALEDTFAALSWPVPATLATLAERSSTRYGAQVVPLPRARDLLETLSGSVPLALITNGPEDMQRAALANTGLGPYFKTVVISGAADVAVRKPDARIFALACARLGVAPEDTLMVGDNLEADVRGALAVGMQALYLGEGEHAGVERVTDLTDLSAWLSKHTLAGGG